MDKKDLSPLKKAELPFNEAEQKVINKIVEERMKVENKFPLAVLLLATFGFVSLLYGFEKLIDRVDLFANNPWILLAVGLIILLVTGTAYRKLG